MKRIVAILVLLVTLAATANAEERRYEGSGYPTPEAAVLAYIQGMRDLDLSEMASTFAIEAIVDNMDAHAILKENNGMQINYIYGFPAGNDYSRQLGAAMYYFQNTHYIFTQYIVSTAYGSGLDGLATECRLYYSPERESVPDVISRYIEAMSNDHFTNALAACAFVEWIEPEEMMEGFHVESFDSNRYYDLLDKEARQYGADEFCERIAHIRLNDEDVLLALKCCRYGDNWYNFSANTRIGRYVFANQLYGGFIPMFANS